MIELTSAVGVARMVQSRTVSAVEVVEQSLAAIDAHNGSLNALREVYAERAMQRAAEIDTRVEAGEKIGALAGVPIAIKDNMATDFGTTACGSRFLENYASPFTATAVARLIEAGAIIVGRTNCDEFAMGSSNEHCAYGAVKNPWDTVRVPGGSSGGSAAAVAAGMCTAALGSDTGGSVRQPAAMCGVVGLRPSYGRVSRHGLVAFASSLDQIGPITNTVDDAAILLGVIAGADPFDGTCLDRHVPNYVEGIDEPLEKMRLGIPKQFLSKDNHPQVTAAFDAALQKLSSLGAQLNEIDLPMTDYGIATYYLIAAAEASSNLARFDGVRYGQRAQGDDLDLETMYVRSRSEGFGAEVRRRIMLGTFALSAGYYDAYYRRALKARRLISREFESAFGYCDAIVGPTSPVPAFALGSKPDPLSMYQCDVYTVGASIAGLCAVSIPCGFASEAGISLPIGLQIQCPAFQEPTLLRLAKLFETNRDALPMRPPAFAMSQKAQP